MGHDDWSRLRIGIDAPGDMPLKNYVLGRFRPDQLDAVEGALDRAAEATECWIRRGLEAAMNAYNGDQ